MHPLICLMSALIIRIVDIYKKKHEENHSLIPRQVYGKKNILFKKKKRFSIAIYFISCRRVNETRSFSRLATDSGIS